MSTHIPTSPVSTVCQNKPPGLPRPLADFHPNLWGDQFVNYVPVGEETIALMRSEVMELKDETEKILARLANKSCEQLRFIDALQNLGVAYHFEEEIEEALHQIYKTYEEDDCSQEQDNINLVSLRFRLLRRYGFHTSWGIFQKFTDASGRFKNYLISDVEGLLSLYEASHLRTHGDYVLDEALQFSTYHLKSIVNELSEPLAKRVLHALEQPFCKGMTEVEARYHISIFKTEDLHNNKTLLKFAAVDFNFRQSLHKKELGDVSRWWWGFNFAMTMPFARERVVEAYFACLGILHEPKYSRARVVTSKMFKLISITDDTYDAYGTLDELELFTDAFARWDYSCIQQLPDYMKLSYRAILDTCEDINKDLAKEGRSHLTRFIIEQWKIITQAYLQEAKWRQAKHVPTYDEYLNNAIDSSTCTLMIVICYIGMGDVATENTLEWLTQKSKSGRAVSIIGRLLDDIGGHKFDQKRNHVASAVECYMKQYGVTEEQTYEELTSQVNNAWKDIYQEALQPTPVAMCLMAPIINFACALYVIYLDEDGYTTVSQRMKDHIASLLIDPINI